MALLSLLDKMASARILVIGDLMIDHYIWGDIHRISPEAPVPVVHIDRDTYAAGGAANVALNLANLGVCTSIIGYYSKDEAGIRLNRILSDNNIESLLPGMLSSAPTITKSRVVVRNQQLCRLDREVERKLYRVDDTYEFGILLKEALAKVDAVIISDYAKGVITQALVDKVISFSRSHPSLFVAIDPKPSRGLLFKGVDLMTPNMSEALQLAGLSDQQFFDEYPLKEVCRRINKLYSPKLLIITLGAEGLAICKSSKIEKFAAKALEVFDVSGAGDTVIATLTASLAIGASERQAAQLANAAAGCVVSHMGTSPITIPEFKASLKELEEISLY